METAVIVQQLGKSSHSGEMWNILLTVPRRYFFCGSFMLLFCLVFAMSLYAFICALWSPAGKGLTFAGIHIAAALKK